MYTLYTALQKCAVCIVAYIHQGYQQAYSFTIYSTNPSLAPLRHSKGACFKRVSLQQMPLFQLPFPFQQIGKSPLVAKQVLFCMCPPLPPPPPPPPKILLLRGTLLMPIQQMFNCRNPVMPNLSSNVLLLHCAYTIAH